MGSKTAAILSLLCTLAVCSQPSDQKLLSPKTPILPQGGRSAALYGTDQVIVPKLDTGDDVSDQLISAINEDAGTILEGEDDNINDPPKLNTDDADITINPTPNVNGDTIATVVDLPLNDPSENSDNVGVVLTVPQNIPGDTLVTESQDSGSDLDLLITELTKLLLDQQAQDYAVLASVTPNFWPTVAFTPPGQGLGYIANHVDPIVSTTWSGATHVGVIHEAIATAYDTPQTYPWLQQYGAVPSPFGTPLGYSQVHGAQINAIPPVPPNAHGPVQNYPQQHHYIASSSPYSMLFGYPQPPLTAYAELQDYPWQNPYGVPQTYPHLQQYGIPSSPFDEPLGYTNVRGTDTVAISPSSPYAYEVPQTYSQEQQYGTSPFPYAVPQIYSQEPQNVAAPFAYGVPQIYSQEQQFGASPFTYSVPQTFSQQHQYRSSPFSTM